MAPFELLEPEALEVEEDPPDVALAIDELVEDDMAVFEACAADAEDKAAAGDLLPHGMLLQACCVWASLVCATH